MVIVKESEEITTVSPSCARFWHTCADPSPDLVSHSHYREAITRKAIVNEWRTNDSQIRGLCLENLEELDLEDERRLRRDHRRETALPVRVLVAERELGDFADLHRRDAERPALDHALADCEHERLVAIAGGVELRPVNERARVVNGDACATGGGRARSLNKDFFLDAAVLGDEDLSAQGAREKDREQHECGDRLTS